MAPGTNPELSDGRGWPGAVCVRLAEVTIAENASAGENGRGSMQYRRLQRRCWETIRTLDETVGIPRPFDMNRFLDRLEQQRGRPIDLHPTQISPGGPCGLWIAETGRDVIVYAESTSEAHQDHIILHECSHMIAGHGGTDAASEVVRTLASHIDPVLVKHVLARCTYTTIEEQEAEMLAGMIWLAGSDDRDSYKDSRVSQPHSAHIEELFGG